MGRVLLAVLVAAALVAAATAVPVPGAGGVAAAHPQDGVQDPDHDGIDDAPFGTDNCGGENGAYNPSQSDTDGDGLGDACDVDDDADGIDDAVDNCPQAPNQSQRDSEGDGEGDPCDLDDDNDGVTDQADNCRFVANPQQRDTDGDGVGDACDTGSAGASSGGSGSAPGGGGGAAGDAAGTAPADDGRPPRGKVRGLPRRVKEASLGGVLPVGFWCSERCAISAILRAKRRRVGEGEGALDGTGRTYVFVDLDRLALRRLKRGRKLRARLEVAVDDVAGNRITVLRRVTIVGAS